jgi:hypothetical protein
VGGRDGFLEVGKEEADGFRRIDGKAVEKKDGSEVGKEDGSAVGSHDGLNEGCEVG